MNWLEKIVAKIKEAIQRLKDKIDPPEAEPPVTPADPPATPDPGAMPDASKPANYRVGFLWKPVGDGGRPAAALLPSSFTHKTTRKMEMLRGGSVIETSSRAHNTEVQPNGNREHYRWKRMGNQYTGPIVLRVETLDGNKWSWTVTYPTDRYDGKITPTVGDQTAPAEPTEPAEPADQFSYEPGESSTRVYIPRRFRVWKFWITSRRKHNSIIGPLSGDGPWTINMSGADLRKASLDSGDDGSLLVFINTYTQQTGNLNNAGWRIMDPTKTVTGDADRLKPGENR